MTSSKSFIWAPQFISSQAVFDILHALTTEVQFMEELSIDLNELNVFGDPVLLDNPSIWSFTNLTKVNMHHPVPVAVQMVIYCHNIEDLRLSQAPEASIFYMMQYSHWKKLRRLNFELDGTQLALPSGPAEDISAIIISFFDRHPDLESLYFTPFNILIPKLPSTCLPNLRSAGSACGAPEELPPLTLTSFLSDDTMSRLVHWRIPIDNVDINALPQLDKLESFYLPLECAYLPDSFFLIFTEGA